MADVNDDGLPEVVAADTRGNVAAFSGKGKEARSGLRVQGSGLRGSGFRVQGSGFWVSLCSPYAFLFFP